MNYVQHLTHDFEQLLAATGQALPKSLDFQDLYIYIPEETTLGDTMRQSPIGRRKRADVKTPIQASPTYESNRTSERL